MIIAFRGSKAGRFKFVLFSMWNIRWREIIEIDQIEPICAYNDARVYYISNILSKSNDGY